MTGEKTTDWKCGKIVSAHRGQYATIAPDRRADVIDNVGGHDQDSLSQPSLTSGKGMESRSSRVSACCGFSKSIAVSASSTVLPLPMTMRRSQTRRTTE